MTDRLATVIYGIACISAVLWLVLGLAAGATRLSPNWALDAPIAVFGCLLIWGIGRVIRYVLAGR